MTTATQLFLGSSESGPALCFYCAGRCETINPSSQFVKSSFTGMDTTTNSPWVCSGCVAAMNEKATIQLIDGTIRDNQKVRGYSWVITNKTRVAATKAHRSQLTHVCTVPPYPPFVICISESGQKHLLYRAVVNQDFRVITVTLEGERISYAPHELIDRLRFCRMVCAATGKPALSEPQMTQSTMMRIVEHFDHPHVLTDWLDVRFEPLTRLAVFLCPPKEECLHEFPASTD